MRRGFGVFILQIGLALFLLVNGLFGLVNSDAGAFASVVAFFTNLFSSRSIAVIIVMTISVCEIIAAVFLLLDIFSPTLGFVRIILIIFTVLWAINIILVDIVAVVNTPSVFFTLSGILHYLKGLSSDLMVFGALLAVSSRKRSF